MTTTICLDFGNTRLKTAVFKNGELKEAILLRDNATEDLKEIIQVHKPANSILSSVINHPKEIEDLLIHETKFPKAACNRRSIGFYFRDGNVRS